MVKALYWNRSLYLTMFLSEYFFLDVSGPDHFGLLQDLFPSVVLLKETSCLILFIYLFIYLLSFTLENKLNYNTII